MIPYMYRLRVGINLLSGSANTGQRGEVESETTNVSRWNGLLDGFLGKFQSKNEFNTRNPYDRGPDLSSLYPVIMTRFAYFAITKAVSKPIPFRDVPVIRTRNLSIQ
jgi:hypothetical protein